MVVPNEADRTYDGGREATMPIYISRKAAKLILKIYRAGSTR